MNLHNQNYSKDIVFVENTNSMTENKNIFTTVIDDGNKIYYLGTITIPNGSTVFIKNGSMIGLL